MTEKEVAERLGGMAVGLVNALGEGWVVEAIERSFYSGLRLRHQAGYGVRLSSTYGKEDRLSIEPIWPCEEIEGSRNWFQPSDSVRETNTITVSWSKTEAQIARDIQRRILGTFPTEWQAMRQRADDALAANRRKHETHAELCRILGTDPARKLIYPKVEEGYGHIEVRSAASVKFDLNLRAEDALRVAEVIATLERRKDNP